MWVPNRTNVFSRIYHWNKRNINEPQGTTLYQRIGTTRNSSRPGVLPWFRKCLVKIHRKLGKKCESKFKLLGKIAKEFQWTGEIDVSFNIVKKAFEDGRILRLFDKTLKTLIESDVSDTVTSTFLSWKSPKNEKIVLRPIRFLAKQISPAECNYSIWDKKLLTLVKVFEEWHDYLHGFHVTILTDHNNLQQFMSKKYLNRHRA